MSEENKSPWQIEHEKRLEQDAAKERSRRQAARVSFLHRLKITRKSEPILVAPLPDSDDTGQSPLNQPALSYEGGQVVDQKIGEEKISSFTPMIPVIRRLLLPFAILAIVYLGALYYISPVSKIGTFNVVGNSKVTASAVAEASKLRMDDTLLHIVWNHGAIETRISKSSPRIESVGIQWSLPNHLIINIQEYQPVGYVTQNSKTYQVLSNGVIVKESALDSGESQNNFLLNGFSDQQVKNFTSAYEKLKPELQGLIRGVSITPTQTTADFLTLQMSDGNAVRVPLSQVQKKLPYYLQVVKHISSPSTVDMEVGIFATSTDNYNKDFGGDVPAEKPSAVEENSVAASGDNQPTTSGH